MAERKLPVPYAVQEKWYFCGPATLSLVAKYFGVEKTQSELAILLATSEATGTSCAAMANVARDIELSARESLSGEPDDLRRAIDENMLPIIYIYDPQAPEHGYGILDHFHFLIVTGYTDGAFFIHDTDTSGDGGQTHGTLSEQGLIKQWCAEPGTEGRWMLLLSKAS